MGGRSGKDKVVQVVQGGTREMLDHLDPGGTSTGTYVVPVPPRVQPGLNQQSCTTLVVPPCDSSRTVRPAALPTAAELRARARRRKPKPAKEPRPGCPPVPWENLEAMSRPGAGVDQVVEKPTNQAEDTTP
jgi:hypothetical protein